MQSLRCVDLKITFEHIKYILRRQRTLSVELSVKKKKKIKGAKLKTKNDKCVLYVCK